MGRQADTAMAAIPRMVVIVRAVTDTARTTVTARTADRAAASSRTGTAALPRTARTRGTGDTRIATGSSMEMLLREDIGTEVASIRTAGSMVATSRVSTSKGV